MSFSNNMMDARLLHKQSEHAREHERDPIKAINLADKAIIAYSVENDLYGVSEALCSWVLALRHQANQDKQTNGPTILWALNTAKTAVEIAEEHKLPSAIQYANLGKVQKQIGNLDEAIESFKKAVQAQESNPHQTQNRPAVLANMRELLATAQLKSGDESALERAEKAISDLEVTDEDKYNKGVWLSHGHMRIAEAFYKSNSDKAKKHINKARKIINSNPDLVLSKQALEDFENRLKK